MAKKDYRRCLKTIPPCEGCNRALKPRADFNTRYVGKREDIPIIQIAGTVDSENTFTVKRAVDIDKSGIPKLLFKPPIWRRVVKVENSHCIIGHTIGHQGMLNQLLH
ncbi:MAG: hypothetical protein ACLU37_04860 [Collinsella sp.]